jgi:hypothetical protein
LLKNSGKKQPKLYFQERLLKKFLEFSGTGAGKAGTGMVFGTGIGTCTFSGPL